MADRLATIDEHLPGSDRRRSRYKDQHFPVLLGELVAKGPIVGPPRDVFPFKSWAAHARFSYPPDAEGFLSDCGSAAEAYFARAFVERPGVRYEKGCAVHGDTWVALQRRVARFCLDVAVGYRGVRLAVEVDGYAFHGASAQAIEGDYRRQRCLVLNGFYVIRFTAKDALADSGGCWAEIDTILAKLGGND